MAVRRTIAPRKRPEAVTSIGEAAASSAKNEIRDSAREPDDVAAATDLKKEAVQKFEASLREQPRLDAEGLEFILEQFRQAVFNTPLQPGIAPLDADSWAPTLNDLVQNGLLEEDERNALARQFEQAAAVSQQSDTKIVLEFAKRLKRDGEASAMEWLTRQPDGLRRGGDALHSESVHAEGKQAITRSRSRRLRGPPGAV
jgi:hypothetical protein